MDKFVNIVQCGFEMYLFLVSALRIIHAASGDQEKCVRTVNMTGGNMTVTINQTILFNSSNGMVKISDDVNGGEPEFYYLQEAYMKMNSSQPVLFSFDGDIEIRGHMILTGTRTLSIQSCQGNIVIKAKTKTEILCKSDQRRVSCEGAKKCTDCPLSNGTHAGGGAGGKGGMKSLLHKKCLNSSCVTSQPHDDPFNKTTLFSGNPGCAVYSNGTIVEVGKGGGAIEFKAMEGKILIGSVIDASGENHCATGAGGTIRLVANQVEISDNGELISSGGQSCSYDATGSGGIVHIIVKNLSVVDHAAISVQKGGWACVGDDGRILIEWQEGYCRRDKNASSKQQWEVHNQDICSMSLEQLAKMPLNASNIANVADRLKSLTAKAETLDSLEMGKISKTLEQIANVKELPKTKQKQVSDNFFGAVDNILNANSTVLLSSQKRSNSSKRVTDAIEMFSQKLSFPKGSKQVVELNNIAVSLATVTSQNDVFNIEFSNPNNSEIEVHSAGAGENKSKAKRTAKINGTLNVSTNSNATSLKVVIILYRVTALFQDEEMKTTAKIKNCIVIAISIVGVPIIKKENAIRISYGATEESDHLEAFCVFWDYEEEHRGKWSRKGCFIRRNRKDKYDECNCNHLTNFAMLLDFEPSKKAEQHKPISIVSYIGCSFSLLAIAITLCTMLYFRELLASRASKFFFNICLALGAGVSVFLACAEEFKTVSRIHCIARAMMNQYFFLASLAWMVLDAYTMYLALVKILPKAALDAKIPRFWICCLACWGIPVIVVGITAGVALDSYGNEEYCLLRGLPMVISFMVPVGLCVLCNITAFGFILHSLISSANTVTSTNTTTGIEQARRGLAIAVSIGLTWVTGFFAIGQAKLVFQYLFSITNSLQGFLIFLFFCVFSKDVRRKFRNKCLGTTPNVNEDTNDTNIDDGNDLGAGPSGTPMEELKNAQSSVKNTEYSLGSIETIIA